MSVVERILGLMNQRGLRASEMLREAGLNHALVTQWKQGKQKPSTEAIMKIADYFGVTTDYLLKGESTMANNSYNQNVSNAFISGQTPLSKEELKVLEYFRDLEVEERLLLFNIMKKLVNTYSEKNMSSNRMLALRFFLDFGEIYKIGVADTLLKEELEKLCEDGFVTEKEEQRGIYILTPVGRLYAEKWAPR